MLQKVHPEWEPLINNAMSKMQSSYLAHLSESDNWLPGKNALFNAFTHPLSQIRYILMGESPYPRAKSANGYAFWDSDVGTLWSDKGLSKQVNRATSLRNMIKMLLNARGDLSTDFSQLAIARLDKTPYVKTINELFLNFIARGFLLLNASLVLSNKNVNQDAKAWKPFIDCLLEQLYEYNPSIKLLLFGKIAQKIDGDKFSVLVAEHPYNLSFITNPNVVDFFKPLNLLEHQ